jgi:chorismate mutase
MHERKQSDVSSERGKLMEIADWRTRIDALDEQIVRLLGERAECAVAIGEIKRQNGAAIYEPQREQQVFEHARSVNRGPLTAAQVQDIYERIMDVMRSLQRADHGAPSSAKTPDSAAKG